MVRPLALGRPALLRRDALLSGSGLGSGVDRGELEVGREGVEHVWTGWSPGWAPLSPVGMDSTRLRSPSLWMQGVFSLGYFTCNRSPGSARGQPQQHRGGT